MKAPRDDPGQLSLLPVDPRFCSTGAPVWYRQTDSSWQPCRVVESSKRTAVIEPVNGSVWRRLRVPWSELRWQPPF